MDRPRIVVSTSTFPRWAGDAEPPFVFDLSQRLCDNYDVLVLAPHFPGAKRRERFSRMTVVRYRYGPSILERLTNQGGMLSNLKRSPILALILPFFFCSQFLALLKLTRSGKRACIHAHWIIPQGIIAALVCCLLRRPPILVCTSHGSDLFSLNNAMATIMRRFVYRRADALTVVSRAMKKFVVDEGAPKEKISVIPMGVDLKTRFVPHSKIRPKGHLLFVGRLISEKGIFYLLRALPIVLESFPDTLLTIIGDGPELHNCRILAKKLGILHKVRFTGGIPNDQLPKYYNMSDIVIYPTTISEGFGLVLVEAMGCECAVITTNYEAADDIITNGKNGVIVPQEDYPAIADAVRLLLNNTGLKASIVEEGRRSVERRFDWDIIGERFRGHIAKLLKSGKTKSNPLGAF